MILTLNVNTLEMLAQAESGIPCLANVEMEPAWLDDVEIDIELIDIVAHTKVSPETAAICTQELAAAKKRNWRIID